MSTRKSTATPTASLTTKVENVTITTTTTTSPTKTTTAATIAGKIAFNVTEKLEMGANASTDIKSMHQTPNAIAGSPIPTNTIQITTVGTEPTNVKTTTTSTEDAETSTAVNTEIASSTAITTPIGKEVVKALEVSKQVSNEPKRVTRNSPLMLTSPTSKKSIQHLDEADITNSESEDTCSVASASGISTAPKKRGRKPKVDVEEKNKEEVQEKHQSDEKALKDGSTKDKDSSECKDSKECVTAVSNSPMQNSMTTIAAATNRITRKSVAEELALKTRITRNRRTSFNNNQRPNTPPTRVKRVAPYKKASSLPINETTSATKRKRSEEDTGSPSTIKATTPEPGPKYLKVEIKDDSEQLIEDDCNTTEHQVNATESIVENNRALLTLNEAEEAIKIKQELCDSDDGVSQSTNEAPNASIAATSGSRGRGVRWSGRKSVTTQNVSPSTRATRQTKFVEGSVPVTAGGGSTLDVKRRRVAPATSGRSLLKPSNSTTTLPDEDSKDSMASSIDELPLALMKIEKLTPDILDEIDSDMEQDKPSNDEKVQSLNCSETSAAATTEPLSVDTEVSMTTTLPVTEDDGKTSAVLVTSRQASSPNAASTVESSSCVLEKAPSLSPDISSESISAISVKQFYNKPKFLENNLGIEQDPKLGEIVQKVSGGGGIGVCTKEEQNEKPESKSAETIKVPEETAIDESVNNSNESLKEGELTMDESADNEQKSASEEQLSLLFVEEDEEVDDDDKVEKENLKVATSLLVSDSCSSSFIAPAVDEVVEDIGDENAIAFEESETLSVDNTPAVHDGTREESLKSTDVETTKDLTNDGHGENDFHDVKSDSNKDVELSKAEEKTTSLCDIDKAKLMVSVEFCTNDKAKLEDGAIENIKSDDIQPIEQESISNDDSNACEMKKSLSGSSKDENNMTGDDVLARIDAELRKIGERLKEKPMDETVAVANVNDQITTVVEENKENIILPGTQYSEDDKITNEQCEVQKSDEIKVEEDNEDEKTTPAKDNVSIEKMDVDEENLVTVKADSSSNKTNTKFSDDDSKSMKSVQITDSCVTQESECDEETLRQKEQHLKNLGLLTHKAAEMRRLEVMQHAQATEATRAAAAAAASSTSQQNHNSKRISSTKNAGSTFAATLTTAATASASIAPTTATAHEYTGTLKTVIKLNRNSNSVSTAPSASTSTTAANSTSCAVTVIANSNNSHTTGNNRKGQSHSAHHRNTDINSGGGVRRQSLKMTFQKGRARGAGSTNDRSTDHHAHEDAYYTIQNENEDSSHSESGNHHGHHETSHQTTHGKKDEKEEILIPEKASSFKFHPGRLCEDQCYYCSGKFGLYDTPCHVGQIKSVERQQKILANEEKLTVDNCLCDACFRHVDRRANVPSYKKRLSASAGLETIATSSNASSVDGTTLNMTTEENNQATDDDPHSYAPRKCLVPECTHPATHSLRRKCIRKSVKKFLLNFDLPTGSPCIWLCQSHYDTVIQCSGCVLCKRRLGKNHMYHITSDTDRLEKALSDMGIPVQLGIGTAVCKLCRYFANLLMKPPDSSKSQKAEFVKNYRKRLLQFHNIHDGSNDNTDADEEDSSGSSATIEQSIISNSTGDQQTPEKAKKPTTTTPGHSSTATPSKEQNQALSPTASTVSSIIECIADEDRVCRSVAIAAEEPNLSNSARKEDDTEISNDYDLPMISTDSNSSRSCTPKTGSTQQNANANGEKEISKLKEILQRTSCKSSTDTKDSASDISNALRANPNISMRELFPGEEDLGLQFNAPLGSSSSQRTPEGWTRVQTFLQYDDPTRRLWEELQKPYGNQSSFLRHLILLEKYYRNGDLVLSQNASSNASVYTQTVRQRLTSYDQGHQGGLLSARPANFSPTLEAAQNNNTKTQIETVMATQTNTVSDIPTYEINEDEDSNEQQSNLTESSVKKSKSKQDQQLRTVSVDKLTKQLSTNAVTITARPKDNPIACSNVTGAKLNNDPSPHKTLLKDKDIPATHSATATAASTITNTAFPSPNSRSILKANLMNKGVEILPISNNNLSASATSSKLTSLTPTSGSCNFQPPSSSASGISGSVTESKQQNILEVANKLLGNQIEAQAAAAAAALSAKTSVHSSAALKTNNTVKLLNSPPELVSLQPRRSSSNLNTNAGSAVGSTGTNTASGSGGNGNSSSSANTSSIAVTGSANTTTSLINAKRPQLLAKSNINRNVPPNVVILPDSLTPQERLQSKSWRPTLMPVEENQHLLNKSGPLYQTADGRRLPALVQVQSGGKPFLISIFDYNRMCILRREKLLRDQMLKATKNRGNSGSGGNGSENNKTQQQHQQQQQLQQQQQHQQQQHHAAVAAAAANLQNFQRNLNAAASKQQQQQQSVATAQQQLLHLQLMQQLQKQQQAAMNKEATKRYIPIAPKPSSGGGGGGGVNNNNNNSGSSNASSSTATSNVGTTNIGNNFPGPMMPLLANAITNAAVAAANSNAANAASSLNSASWLWNNFPDANQLLLNGGGGSSNVGTANNLPKMPQLLPKPGSSGSIVAGNNSNKQPHHHHQQQQNLLLDNTLMSKIPKSLTVIPQHKLMGNTPSGKSNITAGSTKNHTNIGQGHNKD